MSVAPASLPWFAAHELRLAWRETIAMMTGGRRVRALGATMTLIVVYAGLHLLAFAMLLPFIRGGAELDKPALVMITGSGLLFWTVMLSQALESVTRVYYARSDLDLILSSPASSRRLFAVRTAAVALSAFVLTGALVSPLLNVLAIFDNPAWLAGYAVVAALAALSTALAVAITLALFRWVGPKRTRLVAQIVAAIVGAGFIIGIQAAAIVHFGNMSRLAVFQSAEFIALAPDIPHPLYVPALAVSGDLPALAVLLAIGFGALGATILFSAANYGRIALSTLGLDRAGSGAGRQSHLHSGGTPRQALRRKEWLLLRRDPWLLSQTLMQILYLIPPALLLWLNFGHAAGAIVVVVPVLVMASGQLAGGLAWLAISGEDAHDLVATAPVSPRMVLQAKIEAVLAVVLVLVGPLVLLVALASSTVAAATAVCIALAAGSATAIQLWFRTPMRRSMFRRRQIASRVATLSEAFASIMWAGAAALLAAGSWLAAGPAILALMVLGVARLLAPRRRNASR